MAIGGANQYAETMTNPEPRWANLEETAEHMRLHRRTVQRLAAAGTITAHRLDGTTRYDLREVDAVLSAGIAAERHTRTVRHATPADVIARIRAALPTGTGRPLIPLAQVHAAIDRVEQEVTGVDRRHSGLGLPCEVCPGPCTIDGPAT